MTKYNTKFELDLEDMELIEAALRKTMADQSTGDTASVHDLLGRLHNQKVFYRPKSGIYVSG